MADASQSARSGRLTSTAHSARSASRQSATTGTCTGRSRPISAASRSTWITAASGGISEWARPPVSRPSRAPSSSTTSGSGWPVIASSDRLSTAQPLQRCAAGSRPSARLFANTGMPARSAKAASSAPHDDHSAPPPTTIAGRSACKSRSAAARTAAGEGAGRSAISAGPAGGRPASSTAVTRTSIGISRKTGPGRPDSAVRTASATRSGMRSVVTMRCAHLVTGAAAATWSNPPCISLVSNSRSGGALATISIGTASLIALGRAANPLANPGPDVTTATPSRPVVRA